MRRYHLLYDTKYLYSECLKIPSQTFCVLLCKQKELNSWILRLGKAGLVVPQTGDRRLQTSLYDRGTRAAVCQSVHFSKY